MRRRLLLPFTVLLGALALGGCVRFTGPGAITQQDVFGPVVVERDLCSTQSGTVCAPLPAQTPSGAQGQLLLSFQVATWVTAPTTVAVTSSLGNQPLERFPSLDTAMQAVAPAALGHRWVGYRSPTFTIPGPGTAVVGSVRAVFGVGEDPPDAFDVVTVAGFRSVGAGAAADRAAACGASVTDTDCDLARTPATGSTIFALNELGLTPPAAPVIAAPGTAVDVPFGVRSSTATTPGLPIPASATTTVPGASVTAPSLLLGSTTSGVVRVNVPTATAPGDYAVELVAGAGTGERRATATLRLPAPPVGPPAVPPAAAGGPGASAEAPITAGGGGATGPAPTPPAVDLGGGARALATALGAPGARAALRQGRLRFQFTAPAAGNLRLSVLRPKTKRRPALVVASAKRRATRAGLLRVPVRLTGGGRALIAKPGAQRLTLRATFTHGGDTSVTTRRVTLP
ncbi:MAG: hypothetical protein JHC95_07455 [Solirubrobacteraceae bacterium]|nr:hypothetical protein [Solirubrobacteraceae bacterium]